VGLPAGGRLPFLPLYRADMIRLYGLDFISLRPPFAAQIIPCAAIERRAEQPRLSGISGGAGSHVYTLAGAVTASWSRLLSTSRDEATTPISAVQATQIQAQ
jgi:hypothetical protein